MLPVIILAAAVVAVNELGHDADQRYRKKLRRFQAKREWLVCPECEIVTEVLPTEQFNTFHTCEYCECKWEETPTHSRRIK